MGSVVSARALRPRAPATRRMVAAGGGWGTGPSQGRGGEGRGVLGSGAGEGGGGEEVCEGEGE